MPERRHVTWLLQLLPAQVLVTGASGKTGALVVSELLKLVDNFEVRVTIRNDQVGRTHYSTCGVHACTCIELHAHAA
jgi:hypothetical protein